MKINFELGQDYINYSAEYPAGYRISGKKSVSGATLLQTYFNSDDMIG